MATVTSLTSARLMELLAGWESVELSQEAINAAIVTLRAELAAHSANLTEFQDEILPELEADLAAGSIAVADLNETTIPNLQASLSDHSAELLDLNSVWIPGLQEQITSNSNWVLELDEVTLPALQVTLDAHALAIDDLNVNALPELDSAIRSYVQSRGTDLVTNGTGYLKDNTNFSGFIFDPADAPVGSNGSFWTADPTSAKFSDEILPVNPLKFYKLTSSVRQRTPGNLGKAYMGVAPYDSAGLAISPVHYAYQPNTTTTLAAPLNPGDTTVTLTSAANWNNNAGAATYLRSFLFWDYVDSFGKSWPVGSYSRNIYQNVYADGAINGNVITLSVPWAGPIKPAGTALSNGTSGGSYIYGGMVNVVVPEVWTQYSAIFGGQSTGGVVATAATGLPPGTAGVKLLFLANRDVANSAHAFAGISFSDASAAYDRWAPIGSTTIDGGKITADSLTATQIAANAITATEIAADAVTAIKILASSITASKIAANAVTANAIAAEAITASKIAADAVTAASIAAGSITTLKLAVGAVTASRIAADTITASEIAADTITANEIYAGTITAEEIAANTITANEIAVGAITTDELAAGSVTAEKVSGDILVANEIYGKEGYFGTLSASQISAGELTASVSLSSAGIIRAIGANGEEISLSGAEGFLVTGPNSLGNPVYVTLPTDGRPNVFGGTVNAKTVTVEGDENTGQAASFRRNSQLEPEATFTLNSVYIAPVSAPVLESTLSYAVPPGFENYNVTSMYWRDAVDELWFAGYEWFDNDPEATVAVYKLTSAGFASLEVVRPGEPDRAMYNGAEKMSGLVEIDSVWYGLFWDAMRHKLVKFDSNWNVAGINRIPEANIPGNSGVAYMATYGGSIWIATLTDFEIVFLEIDPADVSGVSDPDSGYISDLPVLVHSTGYEISNYNGTGTINSFVMGNFDFGSLKFVVMEQSGYAPPGNAGAPISLPNIRVFNADFTRNESLEFQPSGLRQTIVWRDFNDSSVNDGFWGYAGDILSSDRGLVHYRGPKFANKTQQVYGSYTYYVEGSGETSPSPQASYLAKSRWVLKLTIGSASGSLSSRVYLGTVVGNSNSHLQDVIDPGELVLGLTFYDDAGDLPPLTSTFESGTPALIQSQIMVDDIRSTTSVSGSPILTGTAFAQYLVGKDVVGNGIPAGTRVLSVESSTSLTMSANSTVSSSENRTFKVPKLEIRGDGYARITELERVVLTSITDVNALAGNTPPLRIGDIAGVHMRFDGNEIQGMATDASPGGIILQQGGGSINMNNASSVSMLGKTASAWNWATTTVTTDGSGEATISHGLGGTPGSVIATIAGTGELANKIAVTAWSTTTFTVKVRNSSTNALTTGASIGVRWFAIR